MGSDDMPADEYEDEKLTKKYVNRKAFQNGVFYRIPLTAAN